MDTYQRLDRALVVMVGPGVQIEGEKIVTTEKEIVIIRKSKSTQEIVSLDKEKNEN